SGEPCLHCSEAGAQTAEKNRRTRKAQPTYRIDDDTGQLWAASDTGTARNGARVTVKGTIREGFNLGSLGDQINLPGVGVGLVLMESSHKRLVEPALIEAFRMGPPAALLGEIADARRSVLSNIKGGRR